MNIGKQIRLNRLFSDSSGRLCCIAVDHFIGYNQEMPPGLRSIQPTLAAIVAGPSANTCPRCPPQRAQWTSTRLRPSESSGSVSTLSSDDAPQKLGQPVPDSNFVSDPNSSFPHAAHTKTPLFLKW